MGGFPVGRTWSAYRFLPLQAQNPPHFVIGRDVVLNAPIFSTYIPHLYIYCVSSSLEKNAKAGVYLKKGFVALLHSLIYPLIYMGSQLIASFVAIVAYIVSTSIDKSMADILNKDISVIQNEFVSKYSQQILIAGCVIACLVVLIIVRASRRRLKDVIIIKPLPFTTVALVFVIGISINLATIFALNLLPIPESVINQYNELVGEAIVTDNFWLTLFTTALLVPITEELIFRGMAFNVLRRGMAISLAVIFQTLIFAGAHMLPLQIAYVMPTSLVLALVYVWCDSIIAPITLHIAYNGLSAILSLLPVSDGDVSAAPEAAGTISFIIMMAALIITIVCLLRLYGIYRARVRSLAGRRANLEDVH